MIHFVLDAVFIDGEAAPVACETLNESDIIRLLDVETVADFTALPSYRVVRSSRNG